MKRYERNIAVIDDMILKIKDKENQSDINIQTVNDLFKLKMLHEDIVKLQQLLLNEINIILDQEDKLDSESRGEIVELDYKTKEFWRQQVDFMLKKVGRPLMSKEIIDSCPMNPGHRRQCMSILSNVLAELCKKGVIRKFKIEGEKGYNYALPHMIMKKAD